MTELRVGDAILAVQPTTGELYPDIVVALPSSAGEEVLAAAPGLHAEVHREHMVRLVAVLLEGRDRVGRIRARSGLARA